MSDTIFKSPLLPIAVVVLAVLALFATISLFWPFIADDAFITFRYSANLAAGFGPTYNRLMAPVEGYTTFLWMLLMVIPHLVGADVATFSKIAGVVSTAAFAAIVAVFVHHSLPWLKGPSRMFPATFAGLLISCYGPTAIHAVAGMETSFFTFLMILFLYMTTLITDSPSRNRAGWLALTALLMGLTRPEGNLVALVAIAVSLMVVPKSKKLDMVVAVAVLYALPAICYYLRRYSYYGHAFPLSYYIKVGTGHAGGMMGLADVKQFLLHFGLLFWVLVIVGMFGLRLKHLPSVLAVVSFIVFYLFPNHVLSFDYRFLFPSVPFLFSVAAIGVGVVLGLRLPEKARLGRILMDVGVLLVCVAVSAGVLPSQNDISMKSNFATGMYQAHIPLGMHLAKFPHDEKSPILAISDAGAMPYYSGWRTIDTYGLNDPNIAISGRHDPEYVLSQNPDLLVVLSKRADTFVPLVDFEQGLYEAATAHGMVTVLVVKFFDEYYLWCLVNPASKVEEYLHK